MNQRKCFSCGGDLIITPGAEFGVCSCCGNQVPLFNGGGADEEAYERAQDLLYQKEFGESIRVFEQLLDDDPSNAAFCWGRALAEYGIEYVEDPATGELLPTLHRLSYKYFSESVYVKNAIKNAPSERMEKFYTEQAKHIDTIQHQCLEISKNEEPYDIFICYKRTEENETRTVDSKLAADIYRELVKRGYKVFFAEETLKIGEEYEPRIMAALQSAKALIALAAKAENYEAVWVKNEWERYIERMENELRQNSASGQELILIPVFIHMRHEELPPALRNMPVYIDMDNLVNPKQQLLQVISSHFGEKTEQVAQSAVSGVRRQSQRKEQRDTSRLETSAENLCERGNISLVHSDFTGARAFFENALKLDPNYADAYFGLALCDLEIPGREALHTSGKAISGNPNFARALELADINKVHEYSDLSNIASESERDYEERTNQMKKYVSELDLVNEQIANGRFRRSAFLQFKEIGGEILSVHHYIQEGGKKSKPRSYRIAEPIIIIISLCLIETFIGFLIGIIIFCIIHFRVNRDYRERKKLYKKYKKHKEAQTSDLMDVRRDMINELNFEMKSIYDKYKNKVLSAEEADEKRKEAVQKGTSLIDDSVAALTNMLKEV